MNLKEQFKRIGGKINTNNKLDELSGYDDPKFPKAKYHKAEKAMVDFAKALTKAGIDQKTMEEVFTNMAVRMAKMYGKK